MKKKTIITIIVVVLLQVFTIQFLATQPIGYASMDAWGQNGTTGGAGGPIVTVTNSSDLLDYISKDGPYIVQVDGMISVPSGMHDITSNKTVIGLGSNSGIRGGGLNVGLPIDNGVSSLPPDAVYNVIICNLTFKDANDDCINVMMFSHHIWIHHNTFLSTSDGALDFKRGSSYSTISYNHFRNIHKTCLLGHSDGNGNQDRGRLRVTYHHNWFENCGSRQPRVRFAEAHVFNNYWKNPGYCIGRGIEAKVYSENNHKDGGSSFSKDFGGGAVKDIGSIGGFSTNAGDVNWNPADRYSYTVDPASDVESIVKANAGVGKMGELPTPVPTDPEATPEPTPEPTLAPTPFQGGETHEMQAENAQFSSGAVEADNDGYTGSGYVNTDNSSGEWIEWSINVASATNAACVFRYACESGDRPMNLSINGSVFANLGFPASGAWNTWATETADIPLDAGSTTIRLTATSSSGAPNIDKMDITIHGGEAPTPSPPPPLGDINLDSSIDIIDALLVAQCYVGITECPSLEIGDTNCDGSVDIIDALLIAQFYVGLIDQFC